MFGLMVPVSKTRQVKEDKWSLSVPLQFGVCCLSTGCRNLRKIGCRVRAMGKCFLELFYGCCLTVV